MNRAPEKNSVVLFDSVSRGWLAFENPIRVIRAQTVAEVIPALRAAEEEVGQNRWAAGFVAYEAASALDSAVLTLSGGEFPLVWFGIYSAPERVALKAPAEAEDPVSWQASVGEREYNTGFEQIKNYIAAGHTYQVNFSYRLRSSFEGDPWRLFARMAESQGGGYPVYVDTDDWAVCSASPELFFSLENQKLVSKPMKGTVGRGRWSAEDRERAAWLGQSEKNRAENLMIVDMVRNDMGRIAMPDSVNVSRLFEIEKYRTVWQMTSTVECDTDANFVEIMRALFAAASITGAPKIRTMEIIRELEKDPRRIYTGTAGYFAPGRRAQFNVAIRTVLIDRRSGQAEYGVGGGVVWDSEPGGEFEECQTKARVLAERPCDFSLLETIGWFPDSGFRLLQEHLVRLRESAEYFSRPVDIESIRQKLSELEKTFDTFPQRVRVLVSGNGDVSLETQKLALLPRPYRVRLAKDPVNSDDVFLYHKTTRRIAYERARAGLPDCEDTLLWNERGELTEGCIANLALQIGGALFTPPVSCGLLPGLERARLLATGQLREAILRVEDLARAERVFLLNSVRGLWEASLR